MLTKARRLPRHTNWVSTLSPNPLIETMLIKKIEMLNSDNPEKEYSQNPEDYELSGIAEERYTIQRCRFVEKKTQRVVEVEIKTFG